MTDTPHLPSKEGITPLVQFIQAARMESAYQMLLLLLLLNKSGEGSFSLDEAADRFASFYKLRIESNLPPEKQRGTKEANFRRNPLRRTILRQPYPILFRAELLTLDDERQIFLIPVALQAAVQQSAEKAQVRTLALKKLAKHYAESEEQIEDLVKRSIEAQPV